MTEPLIRGETSRPSIRIRALCLPWRGPALEFGEVKAAAVSHIGGRPENQDRVLVGQISGPETLDLFGVLCDGMGGMADGGFAAALATDCAAWSIVEGCRAPTVVRPEVVLARAAHAADRAVFGVLGGRGGAVLAAFLWRRSVSGHPLGAYINIGDTRVWGVERGRLVQLSRDDTLAELLPAGKAIAPELAHQPARFIGQGAAEDWVAHSLNPEQDGLLLTSDGAHAVPDAVLQFAAETSTSPLRLVERVVNAASWREGDNASAIAVPLEKGAPVVSDDFEAIFWVGRTEVVELSRQTLPRSEARVAEERRETTRARREPPPFPSKTPTGPEAQIELPVAVDELTGHST